MSEKLLGCPFCGGQAEAILNDELHYWEVSCKNDACYANIIDTQKDRAITAWNTRATDTLPVYYLLRRTVGVTTMHYEWWCEPLHSWTVEQERGSLGNMLDMFLWRYENGGEIIPVKLMEVPHAT